MRVETFISPSQAAIMVGLHPHTIRKAMKENKLKYKKIGTNYRTTESWLAEWQCRIDYTEPVKSKKTKKQAMKLSAKCIHPLELIARLEREGRK